MTGTQFISRMIEVIGEALQVDHFQLVAFDYAAALFSSNSGGQNPLSKRENAPS